MKLAKDTCFTFSGYDRPESLYQVLGVEVDATQEELKRAYRRRAARLHPDKVIHEDRERATQEFQHLCHAFEVLSDAAVGCPATNCVSFPIFVR